MSIQEAMLRRQFEDWYRSLTGETTQTRNGRKALEQFLAGQLVRVDSRRVKVAVK